MDKSQKPSWLGSVLCTMVWHRVMGWWWYCGGAGRVRGDGVVVVVVVVVCAVVWGRVMGWWLVLPHF
jgi:hypothetical protein